MAIGTITVGNQGGQKASAPLRVVPMSFDGDGAYAAGGTPDFEDSVQAALDGEGLTVLGVIPQDCGNYVPVYDRAADKLKVYQRSDGAEASGSLAATTFNVLVVGH